MDVKQVVRESYAKVAKADTCCGERGPVAEITPNWAGYDDASLDAAPEGSNMGLGCGNPTAIAGLQPGETVLDLGSGGGFDCFLAAAAVGPTGHVIGVDMTPEMIAKARRNAAQGGYGNVEFRLGDIEALPVDDGTVDVVISNCVINLAPDKASAFAEAFRVLKPGGRLHVSDLVLSADAPDSLREDLVAYVNCIGGASVESDYLGLMANAGFAHITIDHERDATELLTGGCCSASDDGEPEATCCCGTEDAAPEVPAGLVKSVTVSARKPA